MTTTLTALGVALALTAGCYASHGTPTDAPGEPSDCDPYNPEYPTLCHWRRGEPPSCAWTTCPDGGRR